MKKVDLPNNKLCHILYNYKKVDKQKQKDKMPLNKKNIYTIKNSTPNFLKKDKNLNKNFFISKKSKLIGAVVCIYLILGFVFGYVFFGKKDEEAKASEQSGIIGAIKINNQNELKVGDYIDINLTLQNTSSIKPIYTIHVDLFTTKNSVKWFELENLNGGGNANNAGIR